MESQKDTIFDLLQSIPKGTVTTYKLVAQEAGLNNPRHVGRIIHQNINPEEYPCHRVVRSDGSIANGYAFGGRVAQMRKLKEEGVPFHNNKVILDEALHSFSL